MTPTINWRRFRELEFEPKELIRAVNKHFDMDVRNHIYGNKSQNSARALCAFLLKKTGLTNPKIGNLIGYKNHSSYAAVLRVSAQMLADNTLYVDDINAIIAILAKLERNKYIRRIWAEEDARLTKD